MTSSQNAALLQPTQPSWRSVDELVDLVEIFDPEVQVCAWNRRPDPAITSYLSGLTTDRELQHSEVLTKTSHPKLDALPDRPERSAFVDDVARLVEIFRDLLDCQAVGLRLARIDRAMCPRWHVDRVGIRLLCTYQGPGTQWLDDQGIDHRSQQVDNLAEGEVRQADTGDIVLLKGSLWQGNEAWGARHRSPDVGDSAPLRTVISLDPVWH